MTSFGPNCADSTIAVSATVRGATTVRAEAINTDSEDIWSHDLTEIGGGWTLAIHGSDFGGSGPGSGTYELYLFASGAGLAAQYDAGALTVNYRDCRGPH